MFILGLVPNIFKIMALFRVSRFIRNRDGMQCAYSKLFILLFMYLFAGGGRRFNLILHILYFYVPNILHLTLLAHFKYLFSNLI